ncbi:hypothetical protein [Paenibacillus yonginensis]|uniref:hypothetical protein n=1 Tax=Paenibacillus yonginensis TaxID=1462996 RepID=UPI0014716496|nr:hypothetical protein [Paenibacillus yonginensis]
MKTWLERIRRKQNRHGNLKRSRWKQNRGALSLVEARKWREWEQSRLRLSGERVQGKQPEEPEGTGKQSGGQLSSR